MKKLIFALLIFASFHVFAAGQECGGVHDIHWIKWALGGAHLTNPACGLCTSCHISMAPNATSTNCRSCHNGKAGVTMMAPTHIPTSMECDTCHSINNNTFSNATMKHTGIATGCANCHNGQQFQGGIKPRSKPSEHVPTTLPCETCHHSTSNWDANFSHEGVVAGTCATCHNGATTSGMGVTHIPTVASCDQCHKMGGKWTDVPATQDVHLGIASGCKTCHNGSYISEGALLHTTYDHSWMPNEPQCEVCHSVGHGFKCL